MSKSSTFREYITESSLSRIWKQTQTYDSGTISAFRSARDCGKGNEFTKSENQKNSKILKARLLKLGYSVTKIDGAYIENYNTPNAIEVKEESFVVINIKNNKNFKSDLINLGSEFEQDSITFQDHKTNEYYLISTNKCKDGYPGEGKIGIEVKLGKTIFGKDGEFHSKINGRPFVFESIKNKQEILIKKSIAEIRSFSKFAEINTIK